MSTLVFLLEEPSAKNLLEGVLPRVLPAHVRTHFIPFEGKHDLERQMVRKMRGWIGTDTCFVVLRDQDGGDCKVVKKALVAKCTEAGKPDALVRVACRDLESWVLGDWAALAEAFGKPKLAALQSKSNYKNPDEKVGAGNGIVELQKHIPEYQKVSGARRVGAFMRPDANVSTSFNAFVSGVRRVAAQFEEETPA